MARRTPRTAPPAPEPAEERIVDIDVSAEMQESFLEYAYSVIYSRALPDARDGLKPVQRRILYTMAEAGLRPDRGHVKSARVVGEAMGRYHPHGDAAIYDALVRMAQPFSLRVPLVDGHGNFGSLDAGPAAMRYTECRLDAAAMALTADLGEDVVDFGPNYDAREREPLVLPAAFPNLLVNGASGIAVGMATSIPPHNLAEVVAAVRHLLKKPTATLEELRRLVPGPDLPTGGRIVGLDGIAEAYQSGRGVFRVRATAQVESLSARRRGIVVTELPWGVGPERVKERIGDLVRARRLEGIADVDDYTDAAHGTRLVIEVKSGFHPEAILEQLYRLTPMEESFGINMVALVEGQPRTLGLRELLQVYVEHRISVVRRRCAFRRRRAADRLHLVEGLLLAVLDVDEVISIIRSSDDTATARARLMSRFDLTAVQAEHILDMPLRRLTRFSRIELEQEREALQGSVAELDELLAREQKVRALVSSELAEVARKFGTPRRTLLVESREQPAGGSPLEVRDEPCWVLLSSTGLLARTAGGEPLPATGPRSRHDVVVSSVQTTARGEVGLVTDAGRLVRLPVVDLPALPSSAAPPSVAGGAPVSEFVELAAQERPLCLVGLSGEAAGIALGTAAGLVKRVAADYPSSGSIPLIALKDGDRVVGAGELRTGDEDLVFVTSDAHLLRFPADAVRPQGRGAAGMTGVRLTPGARAVFFAAVDAPADAVVVTLAGSAGAGGGAVKVSRFALFPAKGRATGGVRCHRLRAGGEELTLAWIGRGPARAAGAGGTPVELPLPGARRDGGGEPLSAPVLAVAGPAGVAQGEPPPRRRAAR